MKVQHFIDRMSTFCLRFSSSGLPLRIMLSSVQVQLQVLRDFFSFFLIFLKWSYDTSVHGITYGSDNETL